MALIKPQRSSVTVLLSTERRFRRTILNLILKEDYIPAGSERRESKRWPCPCQFCDPRTAEPGVHQESAGRTCGDQTALSFRIINCASLFLKLFAAS